MVIDHIGIVVRSLELGIRQWEELFGYVRNSDVVTNSRQKVRVVFLRKRHSLTVKLLEPLGPDSSISAFAAKGGGLHHICFRCSDISQEILHLKQNGVRQLVAPQPGEAFCNHDIAFLFAENNLNIELIDTTEKRVWNAESEI